MVDILAAFPNTLRTEARKTLKHTDPKIARWADQWLDNRKILMELDGNQGALRDAGSGLPQGLPLSSVLFGLTCGRILEELPDGCSYVDDCARTIAFDNLADKNELASKVQRLLNQAPSAFCKHGMELYEKKTELEVVCKANQKRKWWKIDANRRTMRWHGKNINLTKEPYDGLDFILIDA
jgi:hypothetical protein